MIIVQAPLRVSFVGGGTDLPAFYREHGGAVLSASIDKFVSIAINPNVQSGEIILKYRESEWVKTLESVKHTRFREALRMFGITSKIEIASFADIVASTGLGSSSSFSVALIRALSVFKDKSASQEECARLASELEIDILHEPIGKQDQYAAALGGFNIIRFNRDDSVTVEPLHLGFKKRAILESHCMLFYTGITRSASDVLAVQQQDITLKIETYKKMADSVDLFRVYLESGDMKNVGAMLDKAWEMKRSLSSGISSSAIDKLYALARECGAYGGKLLGAGGGGCVLIVAAPGWHAGIREALANEATTTGLDGFKEIPFCFTQAGVETIHHSGEARHA